MSAPMSSTLGPAVPPAGGSQGGAHVNRGGGAQTRVERGTTFAIGATGATARQIDWWARNGLLGPDNQQVGSGGRRRFDDVDLEAMVALRNLAALGATEQWLAAGAVGARAARVQPGEWLIVTIAGHALRCCAADLPHIVHRDGAPHAAWLVPLQAFDQGRPR